MTMHRLDHHRGKRSTSHWTRALWLALALMGCGGGVDSGGTGGASFASGPITGFGSVIVNGVRFDDTRAAVTDADGLARSRDDLRLGMTTEIRGSVITTDATGASVSTAGSIAFGSEILGRVESIDLAGTQLVVLGQTVDINATTVFDDVSVSGGLPALAVGDVVEVYGLFAATGHYRATRIERKTGVTAFRLRGLVSNLDPVLKTFEIGSERISYAGFTGVVPATLANGAFSRVRLLTDQVGGAWVVAAFRDGVAKPRDMDEVRLEGLISTFASQTQFSVDGVAVDASGANPPAGLASGVRVKVEATANGGVLVASKVEIETEDAVATEGFELRGPIASVDAPGMSFVLRGVTVRYFMPPTTDYRDGLPANLAAGVNVEARGVLSADGTRLIATRITFR
jgi:Domain of unknown function (DUF5666)